MAAFLSPLTNRREDDLGGGLEGRAALPLAVIDAVRDGWDRPLIVAFPRCSSNGRSTAHTWCRSASHSARL